MASRHSCQLSILFVVMVALLLPVLEGASTGHNRRLLQAPPGLTFPGFPAMPRFPIPSFFPPMFPSPSGSGSGYPSPSGSGFPTPVGSGSPPASGFPAFPRFPGTPNPTLPNAPAAPAFTPPRGP